jgi:hypothetical protein
MDCVRLGGLAGIAIDDGSRRKQAEIEMETNKNGFRRVFRAFRVQSSKAGSWRLGIGHGEHGKHGWIRRGRKVQRAGPLLRYFRGSERRHWNVPATSQNRSSLGN